MCGFRLVTIDRLCSTEPRRKRTEMEILTPQNLLPYVLQVVSLAAIATGIAALVRGAEWYGLTVLDVSVLAL